MGWLLITIHLTFQNGIHSTFIQCKYIVYIQSYTNKKHISIVSAAKRFHMEINKNKRSHKDIQTKNIFMCCSELKVFVSRFVYSYRFETRPQY